jgi:transposase InsO family protein
MPPRPGKLPQGTEFLGPPLVPRQASRTTAAEFQEWLEVIRNFGIVASINGILTKYGEDARPYLSVTVMGHSMNGLLDSGSSHTLLGRKGIKVVEELGIEIKPMKDSWVVVADGRDCTLLGSVDLPVEVEGRVRIIRALCTPSITSELILGLDFWKSLGIIPDVSRGTWTFGQEDAVRVNAIVAREGLAEQQERSLNKLIEEDFPNPKVSLGCFKGVSHTIDTGDHPPIKQRYFCVSPVIQASMNTELDEMLRLGVVEPSTSAWSSPVVMTRKKDGTYRFCIDFRKVNAITKKDAYPLPKVNYILDRLRDARFLTTLDIKSAYWQVPMDPGSKEKTAFTVPGRGLYQFNRMPFGLCNSPATWQRLIDHVLGPVVEPYTFAYMDDIVICTPDFNTHLAILKKVFGQLREAGLTLNHDKCIFGRQELRYLGYVVDKLGLRPDPEKVDAIANYPVPKTPRQIKQFLGVASWYRRFVPSFASIGAPLNALLRKNTKWKWSEECQEAFDLLKTKLVEGPVLACPNFELPFVIQTDASTSGLGAVLTQDFPEGERVIAYASRGLQKSERVYSATELECLAVVWSIEKFRPYIEGMEFTVITDHHSLQWLNKLQNPSARLARWSLRLQPFTFKIRHRPGRQNQVADALSRCHLAMVTVTPADMDSWYRRMVAKVEDSPERFPLWRVDNEVLYKKTRQHDPIGSSSPWKVVVPKSKRRLIMHENHNPPTAGHLGNFKTINRIRETYYWPKLAADVKRYVRRCDTCLAMKPETKKIQGEMGGQRLVDQPWKIISSDLMGPFPTSSKQNRYLLVTCDYFTKYVVLRPLRKATSTAIIRHLEEEVFMVYGVPESIICDNGVQYTSKDFRDKMTDYGVHIRYSPVYHAQTNPTERVNRVIKTMLSSYVKDNHKRWDACLPQLGFALRTARHEATNHSPAYLNFGRHLRPSGEGFRVTRQEELPQVGNVDEWAGKLEKLKRVCEEVEERLGKAFRKNEKYYNLRRRPAAYNEGDTVWKKEYHLSSAADQFSAKLAPKFRRCRISKKVSHLVYELVDESGRKLGTYHVKDLKSHPSESPREGMI